MADELPSVPPPSSPVYRVARGPDPFEPPPWRVAGEDGTFGGRFDDPRGRRGLPEESRFRSIYAASQRVGAFGEAIARFRPSLRTLRALAAIEDADEGTPPVAPPTRGVVPEDWRARRRFGATELDPTLRFVDLRSPRTWQALRPVFARIIGDLRLTVDLRDQAQPPDAADAAFDLTDFLEVDSSLITGGTQLHRLVSQELALWAYELRDEAGRPLYSGLAYPSRLNPAWECWAVFQERMVHSPTGAPEPILADDPGLVEAARFHGLHIVSAGVTGIPT